MSSTLAMGKLFFFFGLLILLNSYTKAAASFDSESPKQRDIIGLLFDESVLVQMDNEFIIRLSEAELRGHEILSGRREDVKGALRTQITNMEPEGVINSLAYAYKEEYMNAFEFIINLLPSLNEVLAVAERVKAPDGLIEELEKCKRLADEYIHVSRDESSIEPTEFDHLDFKERLPAALRKLLGDAAGADIDSKFLKANLIGKFDLETTFIIYEIEMMDKFHHHDRAGAIESYLKYRMYKSSNESMAEMAFEMFKKDCWSSLKLIVDTKFGYSFPFNHPIWFQNLNYLFTFARSHAFPSEFYAKVVEVANSAAVRNHSEKFGPVVIPSDKFDSETGAKEEDYEIIN